MKPETNSTRPAAPDAQGTRVTVQISATIEREFKRRDIFPELRLENAARIQNGATGIHLVRIERAKELLADAEAMRFRNLELPRGIPVAYGALVRNIRCTLKKEQRRGAWDDPGMELARARMAESPARFEVGDKVLYFSDDEEYGQPATIFAPYAMYCVTGEHGAYIGKEGERFDYRCGYAITLKGSDFRFFVVAHRLSRNDCRPAYLRLVTSAAEVSHV